MTQGGKYLGSISHNMENLPNDFKYVAQNFFLSFYFLLIEWTTWSHRCPVAQTGKKQFIHKLRIFMHRFPCSDF